MNLLRTHRCVDAVSGRARSDQDMVPYPSNARPNPNGWFRLVCSDNTGGCTGKKVKTRAITHSGAGTQP